MADADPVEDNPAGGDPVDDGAMAPAERKAELIAAGIDRHEACDVAATETAHHDGCRLPPTGAPLRGPLAESAVTRELTADEQQRLVQARIARGEEPYPTITPEHRARLEADREAALRDEQDSSSG